MGSAGPAVVTRNEGYLQDRVPAYRNSYLSTPCLSNRNGLSQGLRAGARSASVLLWLVMSPKAAQLVCRRPKLSVLRVHLHKAVYVVSQVTLQPRVYRLLQEITTSHRQRTPLRLLKSIITEICVSYKVLDHRPGEVSSYPRPKVSQDNQRPQIPQIREHEVCFEQLTDLLVRVRGCKSYGLYLLFWQPSAFSRLSADHQVQQSRSQPKLEPLMTRGPKLSGFCPTHKRARVKVRILMLVTLTKISKSGMPSWFWPPRGSILHSFGNYIAP